MAADRQPDPVRGTRADLQYPRASDTCVIRAVDAGHIFATIDTNAGGALLSELMKEGVPALARRLAIRNSREDRGATDIALMLGAGVDAAAFFVRKFSQRKIGFIVSHTLQMLGDEPFPTLLREHIELVRSLNSGPTRALVRFEPSLSLRYFGFAYLARRFGKIARREIMAFHHRFLGDRVIDGFYEAVHPRKSFLWNCRVGDNDYAISLSFNHVVHLEGDLSLKFECNTKVLCEASFTIAPGSLLGVPAPAVLIVARIQGTRDAFDAIRRATKDCQEVSPAYLLMTAMQAIAASLGVSRIVGIGNSEQISKSFVAGSDFSFDYDVFWKTLGPDFSSEGFHIFSVPFDQKPLGEIKATHRRRTRLKRQFKNETGAIIAAQFSRKLLRLPAMSPPSLWN